MLQSCITAKSKFSPNLFAMLITRSDDVYTASQGLKCPFFEFNRGKTMKKVLLTTTALVMTAGVASAEITFSGKGEAGFYRNAPTAAAAAVAGVDAVSVTATQADGTDATANTADDVFSFTAINVNTQAGGDATNVNSIGFNASGVMTTTAATTAASAADAAAIAVTAADVKDAQLALLQAQNDLAGAATHTLRDIYTTKVALATAALASAEAAHAMTSGTAAVAKGATPTLSAYSGYDMNAAVSGASDNGMTFSFGFDMGAGMIADQDDDRAMDAQGAAITNDQLTIGYAGYTIEIGDDLIDDVYDDSQNGDVALSGSLGDLTFKIVHDMDKDVEAVAAAKTFTAATGTAGTADYVAASYAETAAVAAVYNTTSYSLGYTMGDVAFAMASTDHDDRGNAASSFSLSYTMSDSLSATYSVDNVGTHKDIAKLSATAKISDMLSITASVKDDKDHALNTNTGGKQTQDVSISYSAGSLGATIATDESSNWWVNAQYDLGGGAQAFTTFDHSEFLVAGVNFAF
jgi:outer membrane protein OmpU